MKLAKAIVVVAAGVALAATLSSCREYEQGRPLSYEKGVYGGTQDEPISAETQRELQQRARYQSF